MKRKNIVAEIFSFMWQRKAYWLFPVIFFIILMSLIIIAGTTPFSGFIYTIF